jgi:DNA-binding CsgD family transcriptional regulator
MEIATCLLMDFSLSKISARLAVSKKIITAHVRNMMQKLHAKNIEQLVQLLKERIIAVDHTFADKIQIISAVPAKAQS